MKDFFKIPFHRYYTIFVIVAWIIYGFVHLTYSQEVIVGFETKDLPVLNEELKKIRFDIDSVSADVDAISSNKITDADGDTQVQTEESTDEDVVRIDTAGTERWIMTAAGERTMPTQPSFSVHPATGQSNIAIDSDITVVWGTEITDQGGDFASSTFTAPVTGNYLLTVVVRIQSIDSGATTYDIKIVTSNRTYTARYDFAQMAGDLTNDWPLTNVVMADMDASDTVTVAIRQSGGTQQADISTGSYFTGALIN